MLWQCIFELAEVKAGLQYVWFLGFEASTALQWIGSAVPWFGLAVQYNAFLMHCTFTVHVRTGKDKGRFVICFVSLV